MGVEKAAAVAAATAVALASPDRLRVRTRARAWVGAEVGHLRVTATARMAEEATSTLVVMIVAIWR